MIAMYSGDLIKLTVLLSVICFVTCDKSLNSNEIEAQEFAKEFSEKLFKLYDTNYRDGLYNPFKKFDYPKYVLEEASFINDFIKKAKQFDYKNFKNASLRFAFEDGILDYADEEAIGGKRYLAIFESLDKIPEFVKNDLKEHGLEEPMEPIAEIMSESVLRNNWEVLRRAGAAWARKYMDFTLSGLKDASNLTDRTPLDFWRREYNISDMDSWWTEILPIYKELHAFIRHGLYKKYRDSVMKPDGLIPHHLFEQVLEQSWNNNSVFEDMFPFNDLPSVDTVLDEEFTSKELYEIADRFYRKLGFTGFPEEIWENHMILKNNTDGFECEVEVYNLSPNVHLNYCPDMTYLQFLEAHANMGKLYYAKEMTGQPAYFFLFHDLDYAVGKAVVLSASTHQYLKAIGILTEFESSHQIEMNRLLRKGVKSMFNLAIDYVNVKVMADLMSGDYEFKDINTRFWKHMETVGVEPPMNYNTEDSIDLPDSFYYDMNDNYISRKFDSEFVGHKMYKKFCELAGEFPKKPLYLCDFHGSKVVGDALKKMMRLGTSKNFEEVTATIFPENPQTDSKGYLEYYSPLRKLLIEKNQETKLTSGW